MNKKSTKILLSMLLATSVLSGCGTKAEEVSMADSEVKVVESAQSAVQSINQTLELSGTLEPVEDTLVSFEVGGQILTLLKEEGDQVTAGEMMGKIDDTDYRLQVQQAATGVEQAQASVAKVNNGAREQELKQAQLMVEKAQVGYDKAQDDLKKMEQLYQSGAIPKDTYENVQVQAEMTQKDLDAAKAALSLAQAGARQEDKAQTSSFLEQMMVQKKQAESALEKATLYAPMTGTVISKLTNEGQLTGAGNPVYRIGNVHQLKVVLPVPDRQVGLWKVGDEVEIDLYGVKRKGHVQKIYPSTNVGTGTVGVEVVVDNTDRTWLVGQVVKAKHEVKNGTGLFVPVEAVVHTGGEKPFVFVIEAGKAVKTEVETGQLMNNQLEITSGLKEGQLIVSKGADRLFDGDAIEVASGGTSK